MEISEAKVPRSCSTWYTEKLLSVIAAFALMWVGDDNDASL